MVDSPHPFFFFFFFFRKYTEWPWAIRQLLCLVAPRAFVLASAYCVWDRDLIVVIVKNTFKIEQHINKVY